MTDLYLLLGQAACEMEFIADALQQLTEDMRDKNVKEMAFPAQGLSALPLLYGNGTGMRRTTEGKLRLDRAQIEEYGAKAREKAKKLQKRAKAVGAYLRSTKASRVLD